MDWKTLAQMAKQEANNFTAEGQKITRDLKAQGESGLIEAAMPSYDKAELCRRFADACLKLDEHGVPCFVK